VKPVALTRHARQEHEGSLYAGKDVRPIFVDETERVVVVTVYVYLNQRAKP